MIVDSICAATIRRYCHLPPPFQWTAAQFNPASKAVRPKLNIQKGNSNNSTPPIYIFMYLSDVGLSLLLSCETRRGFEHGFIIRIIIQQSQPVCLLCDLDSVNADGVQRYLYVGGKWSTQFCCWCRQDSSSSLSSRTVGRMLNIDCISHSFFVYFPVHRTYSDVGDV